MISKLDVMIKCITLIYREKELYKTEEQKTENSNDLIRTVLTTFKNDKRALQGGDNVATNDLQNLVCDMLQPTADYTKETLLQSLEVILKDKNSIYKILEKAIETDMEASGLKTSIVSLRKYLTNYYKEVEIGNIISRANYDIHANRITDSMSDYITNLINNLETLNSQVKSKDPGLMGELDISDEDSIEFTVKEVKDLNENHGKFQSGWRAVNKMINKGFRRGEQWVVLALQHNYKSGFMQSLFCQFCMHNKPKMEDPNKKPLILYLSFEDDMNIITEFIYRYLYWNETNEAPNIDNMPGKDVARYIKSKLSVNGFYAKILRVNPSEWTYKNIFNKILEYEVQGFEIHALFLDYLSKLPTTYCDKSGPIGTDVRDLFNRLRNFTSAKKILAITAHQLSSDAMGLYRNGIRGYEFLDEVVSKNYYSDSKQISQVVDGEIYLTKGKLNKQWALFIAKGKHRNPVIVSDEDKKTHLMFPKEGLPIKEDINDVVIETESSDTKGSDEFFDL